nr:YceH family protein [uncultured Noviherbaspirillum sp.]
MTDDLPLEPTDIRVLAVLAEKERLTPDNYPLSLNALVNGCNQLTSRDPVMSVSEADVQHSLDTLVAARLVAEVSQAGARVPKYEHRMRLRWTLEQDKLAALVMLMLRGPQTAAEVRSRAGRLHEFDSLAAAEAALQFLIDKYPPLAMRLARAPGTKEVRYAHLLSGEPAAGEPAAMQAQAPSTSARQDRVASLEEEVAALKAQVAELSQEFAEIRRLLE